MCGSTIIGEHVWEQVTCGGQLRLSEQLDGLLGGGGGLHRLPAMLGCDPGVCEGHGCRPRLKRLLWGALTQWTSEQRGMLCARVDDRLASVRTVPPPSPYLSSPGWL